MENNFNFYFIGIGGISMSALAKLLYEEGYNVSGSDCQKSKMTEELKKRGIKVFYKPNLRAVNKSEVVVVSAAIGNDNKELLEAKKTNKKILTRGQLLGQVSQQYKHTIAIAGAHGKTTTTALIAQIFIEAGYNPTVHIGGILNGYKSNLIEGGKKFFITEACEYKDNFLNLKPSFSVVLNIEPEHLDYFKNFENVKKSFLQFVKQSDNFIAKQGLFENGFKIGEDYTYKNYFENQEGIEFDCYKNNEFFTHIKCKLHGKHNIDNILSAIATAQNFDIDKLSIQKGLLNFKGVLRRFEEHQFYNNSKLIFDYAHHPTEIKCSIESVKKFCKGKLFVVFQPHTYSRTAKLFEDFLIVFDSVDVLIIFKTYPAREKYDKKGDAKLLAKKLKQKQNCSYSKNYKLLKSLKKRVSEDDIVLVLGAGDFYDRCCF